MVYELLSQNPVDQKLDEVLGGLTWIPTQDQKRRMRLLITMMIRWGEFPIEMQRPYWNEEVFCQELLSWPYFPKAGKNLGQARSLDWICKLWRRPWPVGDLYGQAKTADALRTLYGFDISGEMWAPYSESKDVHPVRRRCRQITGFIPNFSPHPVEAGDPATRTQFYHRHQKTCAFCNEVIPWKVFQVDHREPRLRWLMGTQTEPFPSLQPELTRAQQDRLFQPVCASCNQKKSRACEKCKQTGDIDIPGFALRYAWQNRFPRQYSGTCNGCYWHCPVTKEEHPGVESVEKESDFGSDFWDAPALSDERD